jgi:hypothetical protein
MGLGRLWRTTGEDGAGGSTDDPLGHAAAEEQTEEAGPAARGEDDQVTPEPPGHARNLVGRMAIHHENVGGNPGLAKSVAGAAELSLCLRPPHLLGTHQRNAGDLGRRIHGDGLKHVEEHQGRAVTGSETRCALHPDARHRGEIGRT